MAEEEQQPFTVLVCGGGNAAQVATAMYSARYSTIAVSLYADEAAKWKQTLGDDDFELTLDTGKVIKSRPDDITNDPSVAAKADAIVLAVPSFAHGQYFEAFEPYIKPDTVIACMPARSGGDLLLAAKLGDKADDVIFVGFETLPWACRFTDWGRKATILGTKGSILAAVTPPAKTPKAFSVLQGLLGVFPNCTFSPNNLGISLRNPGAQIHPGVMYGRWCAEKWDGKPVSEKPLFYQGVEDFSESVLLGLTNEVQAIREKLEELVPGLDLSDAGTLHQWYLDCYGGQMKDDSTLRSCMNTNPGYRGLTHPCKEVSGGKFMPDLKYRYLSEDVPTGLCFNKGLGEILGVSMPMTDKVLLWAQECIGMKIMVNGKMSGPDIVKTRAPQATGIHTLDEFLKVSKIDKAAVAAEAASQQPKAEKKAPAEGEDQNPYCVLVCGGGNAAQVATAMFSARYSTIAVSLFADEAAKWKAALGDSEYELTLDSGKVLKSRPDDITNDPSVAAKADAIVLAVPSFAHGEYFEAFAPYMRKGCVVACMPARSGGDILFASKLGEKAKDMIFMGFETLPWACRFTEWGKKATILGTKGSILAAVTPPSKFPQAFAIMQGSLGVFPHVTESPNNLGISLRNPGAQIHPGVMYGRWCPEKWSGQPLKTKPLFYQGVEDFSESVLLGLTNEVQAIKNKIEELLPGIDLRDACTLHQWYLDCYGGQMTDDSTLKACMNTNPGYRGLTHPCREVNGMFMPDLKYRYLTEDVPTGLCFNKGLGELLGVPMPMTDKVLLWAQECIGLKIMENGKMCGADIGKTRAPQALGITSFAEFCEAACIDTSVGSVPKPMQCDEEGKNPFTVVVCGGGSTAQVATAMFSAAYDVIAVSLFEDEAARWKSALGDGNFELTLQNGKVITSCPDEITSNPRVAAKADCIIMATPVAQQGEYFAAFAPYIKQDTIVVCMPSRSGGDLLMASKLGAKASKVCYVGFEAVPWAARCTEWGKRATILGVKGATLAAVSPADSSRKAFSALHGLMGVFPNITYSPNNIGLSLRNAGAVINPGMMYAKFCSEKWNGKQMVSKPLFYQGVDDFTCKILAELSNEVQAVKKKLGESVPGMDLQHACSLHQWYQESYAGQMADPSSLKSCLTTNPAFRGLTYPCTEQNCMYMPDLKHHFLTEDVPAGMCFNKGLGELLGVPMPMTDKVLDWAQKCIGMKFLVKGKLSGPDVAKTRAPQAFGIKSVHALLSASKINKSTVAAEAISYPPARPPLVAEEKHNFTVLVCGGGNAAQVATGLFGLRYNTIAVSLFADEAARWKAALGDDDFELTLDTGKVVRSKPDDTTNDPSVAARADAIVLAVPSFAHGQYFEAFAPYMKPGCLVVCMPARSGGDILFSAKLGAKAKDMIFMGFETLPWACRFTEWGRKATCLGTKGSILAAVTPTSKFNQAFSMLQGCLGVFPNIVESPTNLGISLRNPGAQIHPGVMYGRWCKEKWDGKPVSQKPLFYQGVDDFTEKVLLGLTNEVQAVKKKMESIVTNLDLKDACTLHQWYLDCYGGQMTDDSTLKSCMNTNPGYRGLTHPCKEVEGGMYVPDLKYRYLSEDVPTGLCFNKGLGELLGVPMPMTDKVLLWAQECIGLSIMVNGKMNGKDIGRTRAPQATGISTIEQFLEAAGLKSDEPPTKKARK
eukprot:CAMPEP_0206433952 /NCGR_PEP_ID=MMETSP0324_2-20121206/8831_1 /ASSEMBLY_ACC=CAM_ASM_000836 /TAXON_ID=2866 /ORGANISM="Crypthecodinium cohnii, Strain Seligo" /LENGTH=1669 /DNA_ID=CAMNT_0053900299 /DNA_START=76 /DNA_END=5085 /DNA_ORIENTATION=+